MLEPCQLLSNPTCNNGLLLCSGDINISGSGGTGNIGNGTTAGISCKKGYTYTGHNTTITCIYGTWDGQVGTCEPNNCTVPSVPHGSLAPNKTSYENNTAITVTCNHNYKLHGQNSTTCNLGNWTLVPWCELTYCDDPVTGPNQEPLSLPQYLVSSCRWYR